jgi:hypothetical protein
MNEGAHKKNAHEKNAYEKGRPGAPFMDRPAAQDQAARASISARLRRTAP